MPTPKEEIQLNFERGRDICLGLLNLYKPDDALANQMASEGFSAFTIFRDHLRSYCENKAQVLENNKWKIEEAKEAHYYNTLLPFSVLNIDIEDYSSKYLTELRKKRDIINGVPYEQIASRFTDEREQYVRRCCDPCERNRNKEKYYNGEVYEKKWREMERRRREQYNQEVGHFGTNRELDHNVNRRDRCQFVVEIAYELAKKIGFQPNDRLSGKYTPALWKPVSEKWGLCWYVETDINWDYSIGKDLDSKVMLPSFYPLLVLCPANFTHKLAKKANASQWLRLPYSADLVGFHNTYLRFDSYNELETNIKAHLKLLELRVDDLVRIIENNVS